MRFAGAKVYGWVEAGSSFSGVKCTIGGSGYEKTAVIEAKESGLHIDERCDALSYAGCALKAWLTNSGRTTDCCLRRAPHGHR